jgi:HTH-type transcriptional regulator/antitoxin HipB
MNKIIPNGNIARSAQDIGKLVKTKRKQDGLTQTELAELCQIGTRFLSELENGKPTLHFDKVMLVLQNLGLQMSVESR